MSHYSHHVFFCTNLREDGRQSCDQCGARQSREYVKKRCKELGISGAGRVRINTAGCLDRCELGPVVVVYPEAVWYTYIDRHDLDEIIDSHLVNGEIVERLLIDPPATNRVGSAD
ncbi:MAG: (2Fe-2S) ferredoxin domain-containing protein [Chromatiaceae bacterium]|jgi:(2Fe-2S) ferredoxin